MKTRKYIRIAILAIILLSSCSQNESQSEAQMLGKTWELSTYNDTQPIAGHQPVLEFESDQISGTTGCNHYGGTYQIDDESIQFEGIFSTEMACLEPDGLMDQERVYLELLSVADQFELINGKLTFYAESIPILVFQIQSEGSQSAEPALEPAEPVAVAADPTPTAAPHYVPPDEFHPYQDEITGITVYIPETWIVTGIIEGQYAILQSYPEDKYVGGEMRAADDTKCDLNIHPVGTQMDDLINQWKSSDMTTILSEDDFFYPDGVIGKHFEIDSMGQSSVFIAEMNNQVVSLTCFGDFSMVAEIATTLRININE